MTPTGRYRFRRALLGLARVLQAEQLTDDDRFVWKDVRQRELVPSRRFAIVRPSQWIAFVKANDLAKRIDRAERARRKKPVEHAVSRFPT